MNQKNDEIKKLILQFVKIMNRYSALEHRAFDFGIGRMLYPSEIHTIEAVGNNEGLIARDIAECMGISKSAVSQTLNKLERKGLVRKVRAEENGKEVLLFLTEEGQKAYRGHERFHAAIYKDFYRILGDIPTGQIDFFSSMLGRIDSALAEYQNK